MVNKLLRFLKRVNMLNSKILKENKIPVYNLFLPEDNGK